MVLPFHVFTSYAHADNRPEPGDEGFVTACVDYLEHQLAQCLGEEYSGFCDEVAGRVIFRDRDGLGACDQWRERMLQHAGIAPIHLVFASEAYFGSVVCAQEWCQHQEYARSIRREHGTRHATSGVVVINLTSQWPTEPTGLACECSRRCVQDRAAELGRVHGVEFGRFGEFKTTYNRWRAQKITTGTGGELWGDLPEAAREALAGIAGKMAEYLVTHSVRVASPTNCRWQTEHYVERPEVMAKVGEAVFGPAGRHPTTLLYGLGGMGKTELAVAVAHEYAPEFPAGRWMITCQGHHDVYEALEELKNDPFLRPYLGGNNDAGRAVEGALHQAHAAYRAKHLPATGHVTTPSTLLICDDIDTVDIMRSIAEVARRAPWLRVIATSRINHTGLVVPAESAVEIPEMTLARSVELLNRFVPPACPSAGEGAAEVAAALRGFTLVLEQAGAYIENSGGHESYRDYLRRLEKHGLTTVGDDKISTVPGAALRIEHQQRLLSLVMESTFESVENAFTTHTTGSVGVSTGQMALDVLHMAALLPVDHIYWNFLQGALARRHDHDVVRDVWTDIRAVLSQHRLIKDPGMGGPDAFEVGGGARPQTTTTRGTVGAMHALIQQHLTGNDRAHLAGAPDAPYSGIPVTAADWRPLGDHLTNLCKRINNEWYEGTTPNVGERIALGRTLADIVDRLPAAGHSSALHRTEWLAYATAQRSALRIALAPYIDPAGWDTIYEILISRWRKLLRQDSGNRYYHHELATTLGDHAGLLREKGDRDQAATSYTEATTLYRGLLCQDPANRDYHRGLALTLTCHAGLLREKGDRDQAATSYTEAITLYRGLLCQDPANRDYRRGLAIILTEHAWLLRDTGDHAEATTCYVEAITLRRSLLDQDPDNRYYHLGLAITLRGCANLLREKGDHAQGATCFAEATALYRGLLRQDPANRDHHRRLAITLRDCANLLRDKGCRTQAATCFAEATTIHRNLLEGDPDHTFYRSELGTTLVDHATLLRETGDLDQAEELFTRAADLLGRLQRQFPDNPTYRHELAKARSGQALCAAEANNNQHAAGLFDEALLLHIAVLTAVDLPKHQRELKITHNDARSLLDTAGQEHDVDSLRISLRAAEKLLGEHDAL